MKKSTLLSCITFCCFALLSTLSQATESKKTLGDIVKDKPNAVEPVTGGKEARLTVYEAEKGNDFGVSLKIATGILNHDFKQVSHPTLDDGKGKITQGTQSTFSLKDSLPFIGLGISARWNKLTVEVYAQKTARGQSQEIDTAKYLDSNFRDSDYSAAIGYEVLKNLSLSAGYKMTILEMNTRESIPSTKVGEIAIPQTTGLEEFTTYGPSLGVAYNWKLNEDMSIATSVAYGWLKGERKSIGEQSGIPQPTQGLSLGISFNHRIPRTHVKYSISFDHYQYDMKATVVKPIANTTLISTLDFDIEQALDTFRATLIYEF